MDDKGSYYLSKVRTLKKVSLGTILFINLEYNNIGEIGAIKVLRNLNKCNIILCTILISR